MSAQTWRDGKLRSVTLETNAFPPEHVDTLPDEVFFDTGDGRVELCRGRHTYSGDYWMVYSPDGPEKGKKFEGFEDAFAHGIRCVREVVEDGE